VIKTAARYFGWQFFLWSLPIKPGFIFPFFAGLIYIPGSQIQSADEVQ
jgi:hypothetical protein